MQHVQQGELSQGVRSCDLLAYRQAQRPAVHFCPNSRLGNAKSDRQQARNQCEVSESHDFLLLVSVFMYRLLYMVMETHRLKCIFPAEYFLVWRTQQPPLATI